VISGGPVVTTLVCLLHIRTRGCGCIGHPAFPTPSILREAKQFLQNSGASRREIVESHLKLSGCLKIESVAMNARAPHPQSSSPGLTGRPSIPETPVMESRSRGVLDRPVKPDDDSSLWRSKTTKRSITVIAAKAGNPVFQRCLRWNREAAAYWILRRSLSSGSPKGETRWRRMTTVCEASDLSAVAHREGGSGEAIQTWNGCATRSPQGRSVVGKEGLEPSKS
jgi:hypothetical protein